MSISPGTATVWLNCAGCLIQQALLDLPFAVESGSFARLQRFD